MKINIDLINDWYNLIINDLKSSGYKIKNTNDKNDLTLKYLSLKRRLIYPTSRKIYKSKELIVPEDKKNGFEKLLRKVENGENLNPYLSRMTGSKLWNQNNIDYLLNHWGIYHFHLGEELGKNDFNFIKRTDNLLFAYLNNNSFYCLNVYDHKSFSKQALIKIIHDNWPELIENKKINGLHVSNYKENDLEIKNSRESGVNPVMKFENDENAYSPLGNYCTLSGDSISDIQEVQQIFKRLSEIENVIKEIKEFYINKIKGNTKIEISELFFKLELVNNKISVLEKKSNLKFNFDVDIY